jgi:hypothetical protein
MTNTLHRSGTPEQLKDDYIVFVLCSKGINDIGARERAQTFFKTALKYKPVNVAGHAPDGPLFRSEKNLNPFKLYLGKRREMVSFEQLVEEMDSSGSALAVFDNRGAMEGFLKELKELDLGLSVNVAALVDDVRESGPKMGIVPHSVNYALGFRGATDRLPDRHVLALTTMCGHGLISSNFAKKMIDRVKERRLEPEDAARYMSKFCTCGAFNNSRAVRILNEARTSS